MRSLRLAPELDEKVRRAAAVNEESVSEFIRHAAEERADRVLNELPHQIFSDVAGAIHGGGGRARTSGTAFTEALLKKKRK